MNVPRPAWFVLGLVAACGGAEESTNVAAVSGSARVASSPPAASAPSASVSGAPSVVTPAPSSAPSAPASGAAAVVDPAPSSAGAPAPLYAELFTKGQSWKLAIKSKHSGMGDDGKPKSSQHSSTATCTVKDTKTEPWGVVSHIDCAGVEAAGVADPVSGWWVATAVGLFHVDDEPKKAPELVVSNLVARATPAASKVATKEDPGESVYETKAHGAAWCKSMSSSAGDEAWTEVCIEAKKGFVSGKWGWAGGASDESEFTASLAH